MMPRTILHYIELSIKTNFNCFSIECTTKQNKTKQKDKKTHTNEESDIDIDRKNGKALTDVYYNSSWLLVQKCNLRGKNIF